MFKNGKKAAECIIIQPIHGWVPINFDEIWRYRELLYFLVWREIKVRYKQTVIGITWAVIQPITMMVIFTLFFGKMVRMPSESVPYPLFAYAALLPWMLFSEGINRSSGSVLSDGNLIKKVYFPRLLLPLSGIVSPLIDFLIALLVFIGLMFYYGLMPTVKIMWLPVFVLLASMSSLSIGIWLSAINARYRDVRYIIPFLLQCWFFVSPVVYPSAKIPQYLQPFYILNPMVGVIDGFRWCLIGTTPPPLTVFISMIMVLAILITGIFYLIRINLLCVFCIINSQIIT